MLGWMLYSLALEVSDTRHAILKVLHHFGEQEAKGAQAHLRQCGGGRGGRGGNAIIMVNASSKKVSKASWWGA